MGLDQTLRRIRKVNKTYQDEFSKGTLSYDRYCELDEVLNFTEDLSDYDESIHKYFTPCRVVNKYVNIRQALVDKYGDNVDIDSLHECETSWGDGSIKHVYTDDDYESYYELVFGEGDDCIDEDKYTFDQEDDMYVFSQDREVAYWRKAYHLQHYMRNTLSYTGNCFYYHLSREMCEQIITDLKAIKSDIHNKDLQDKFNLDEDELEKSSEYIIRNIDYTIECFERAVNSTDFDNEVLCYHEWY